MNFKGKEATMVPEVVEHRVGSLDHKVCSRVPQLTCIWMSLPGASGLGKLTSQFLQDGKNEQTLSLGDDDDLSHVDFPNFKQL